MKHAILILAHKEIPLLSHMVDYFSHDCYVFIHIDKKARIANSEMEELKSKPQIVAVYQKYNVHWGGFSILKSELFLFREALRLCDASFFHLLSGQDYPIKPLDYFLDFFERNSNKNFISCGLIGNNRPNEKNTYFRYQYFLPYDSFGGDRNMVRAKIDKLVRIQKIFGINRGLPMQFDKLYCGSQWMSIPVETVRFLLSYTRKHPSFYNRLKYTFAPEESYFQTLIFNMCDSQVNICKNFRFIRWSFENGNCPANLGMIHFHLLMESENLFARKMESPYCAKVIKNIDKYIIGGNGLQKSYKQGSLRMPYQYDYNLTGAIFFYCKRLNIKNILDFGCGAGLYVAALRRLGFYAAGYDIDPKTPDLSCLLMPDSDKPCGIADLTDDMEDCCDTFDFVMCLNVLQYIEAVSLDKALMNLINLTNKTFLLGWNEDFERNKFEMERINSLLYMHSFRINNFATQYFKSQSKLTQFVYVYESINSKQI